MQFSAHRVPMQKLSDSVHLNLAVNPTESESSLRDQTEGGNKETDRELAMWTKTQP